MKKVLLILLVSIVILLPSCTVAVREDVPMTIAVDYSAAAARLSELSGRDISAQLAESLGDEALGRLLDAISAGGYDDSLWHACTGSSLNVLLDRLGGKSEAIDLGRVGSTFTLGFAGDINFDDDSFVMPHAYEKENGVLGCISPEIVNYMRSADIMLVNNEFAYSNGGEPMPGKQYTFRARPESVRHLTELGVDIVSLANNHSFDYGQAAFYDTLDTLDGEGISRVGAGRSYAEAAKSVCYIINGYKVAFVAATRAEKYVLTPEAGEASPGVVRTYDSEKFCGIISRAKSESDIVIAYVHWGTEGSTVLEQAQTQMAREYIDAGADAVIGAHPHVLQGIEFYNGVPIAYSLGNFWFNAKTLDSCMVLLTFEKPGEVNMKFVPCLQSGSETSLVTDAAARRALFDRVESISPQGIRIDDGGFVTAR